MTGHLVLFFTHDVSLQTWKNTGLYEREIRPYKILAQAGWKISFMTSGDKTDLEFATDLAPIHILPAYSVQPNSKVLRLLLSPVAVLKHGKAIASADIYKTNQFWGGWNAVIARWLYRGRVIARGGYEYLAFAKAQKKPGYQVFIAWLVDWFMYALADKIVLATNEDATFARETFPFLKDRAIDIQPNWIGTDLFAPSLPSEPYADLVYIGRLNAQKNLHALIRAVATQNASLDIYGDGELESELKNLTRALNAKISFKGRIQNDRIPEILSHYKIFILPSLFEGNPKALLEAMACAKAVIGTDVTGITSIIQDGVTGLLCRTDENSIATAIQSLLADKTQQQKLGEAARRHVVKTNSLQAFIENEKARLNSLIIPQINPVPIPANPLISVIMSVYNAADTLEVSVRSILDQSYKNFEFIVVNDGSNDSSPEILKTLAAEDSRILLIDQTNHGLTRSLNIAAARAKGALIARQDADDLALPRRFEQQVERFKKDPGLLLLGGNSIDIYPDGKEREWGFTPDDRINAMARLYTPFPHATAMIRTEAFRALGGYDERWVTSQDTEFWMRLARAGKIAMLEEPLMKRGIHPASISSRRKLRQFRDVTRARLVHYDGFRLYAVYFSVRGLIISLLPHDLAQKLQNLRHKYLKAT